ncbi:DUF3953 domain-containing protein [Alkalihalophilus pseudofirmus]|uniref:DUF3953 domain-containing protein n=1 Tax=Alkalihalophilus pseudofirmus TaxID=79885 RepID=UPI00259BAD94|nr:DUF3953 domain-containing protein [Alkalihalophilus pseudofirmus]WEG15279.1 DUF3953 domain-containing protein [Alkalihalophilus pseudofirmus]
MAVAGVSLAGYGIITQNVEYTNYLLIIIGLTLLTTGVIELQKNIKGTTGYLSLFAALFVLIVAIQGALLGS